MIFRIGDYQHPFNSDGEFVVCEARPDDRVVTDVLTALLGEAADSQPPRDRLRSRRE